MKNGTVPQTGDEGRTAPAPTRISRHIERSIENLMRAHMNALEKLRKQQLLKLHKCRSKVEQVGALLALLDAYGPIDEMGIDADTLRVIRRARQLTAEVVDEL